jgi:general secretion pathway protein A
MRYQHFGLCGPPFNFTPPARLFLSATHRAGLATLKWGLQEEPSGLTLLVGEAGTGKTSLIDLLLILERAKGRVVRVANPKLAFDEMLELAAREIGIEPAGKGKLGMLQSFRTFLMDLEPGGRVVLIFDEAHGLSDDVLEELRLLSNSRTTTGPSLQILLVGQLELAHRLSQPKFLALNQRIGARAMLHPLQGTEIHDYVEHHLREQHGNLTIFSRAALASLARLSRGLPRQINLLGRNALVFAYGEGSATVRALHVRAAAAEYSDVVAFSARHSSAPFEAARRPLRWLRSRGLPAAVGGIVAIVAVAALVAFEKNASGTKGWLISAESKNDASQQPQSSSARNSIQLAAAVRPSENNPDGQKPIPQKAAAPVAPPPAAFQPKIVAENANSAEDSHANKQTRSLEIPEETSQLLTSSPVEESKAPPSERVLSRHASNTIRYDLKCAKEALRARRYNNAIWHLNRAAALDPHNQRLRDLLSSARRAALIHAA